MPIVKRRSHGSQKVMPMQETNWQNEEASEASCTETEDEQSEAGYSSHDSDYEEEVPQQTQSMNYEDIDISPPIQSLKTLVKDVRSHSPKIVVTQQPQTENRQKRVSRKRRAQTDLNQNTTPPSQLQADPIQQPIRTKRVKTQEKRSKQEPITHVEQSNKHEKSGENFDVTKDEQKRPETLFDDSNLDYNLYAMAPQNIVEKKIMLGNNLLVISKMMEASGDKGQTYEYAAISFQRKLKSQKAYTFNLSLNMAPTIIRALELIMDANKTYFARPQV